MLKLIYFSLIAYLKYYILVFVLGNFPIITVPVSTKNLIFLKLNLKGTFLVLFCFVFCMKMSGLSHFRSAMLDIVTLLVQCWLRLKKTSSPGDLCEMS